MGRDAKRAKQARRDQRRRVSAPRSGAPVPAFPEKEMLRLAKAWDRAIDLGLMASGQDVKYHFDPDGGVLSVAEGKSGQVLANGEWLTPAVAERLRAQMPLLAEVVTFYERNQIDGRGLGGAPEDGVSALAVPGPTGPAPAVDERALHRAQAATEDLIAQGLVKEGSGAMVTPFPQVRFRCWSGDGRRRLGVVPVHRARGVGPRAVRYVDVGHVVPLAGGQVPLAARPFEDLQHLTALVSQGCGHHGPVDLTLFSADEFGRRSGRRVRRYGRARGPGL